MPKAILTAHAEARTTTVSLKASDGPFTSGPPTPASSLSGSTQHTRNGQVEAGVVTGLIKRAPHKIGQSPDYPVRLRAAFKDQSKQGLVSREDALGAAAEIEQLWAVFWILAGFTNGNIPPGDQTGMPVATGQYQLLDHPG